MSVTRTLSNQQLEVSYDHGVSGGGFKLQSSVTGFAECTIREEVISDELVHISYTDDEDSFNPYRPAEPLFTFTPRKDKRCASRGTLVRARSRYVPLTALSFSTASANADASSAIH